MASSLTLLYSINGSFHDVYSAFLHFKEFGQLHPYMKSVELIKQYENEMEYEVHEKLVLWGILPMKPSYRATIKEVEKNKHIRYTSEVKKGLFLTINFTFENDQENKSIKISEHILLEGRPWIHAIFLSLLKKSHMQVFENIQAKLSVRHESVLE